MPDRRQVPRYLFNGAAQLSQTLDGPSDNITLESISVTGCRTESAVAPAVGQKAVLTIDWQGRPFRTEVEIVWKRPKGGAGLRFLSVDKESLAVLRDICSSHPLEPLTKLPSEPD
ncbi:MAG: PilZ domain-containing protein [Terriglobia bacterium]